MVKIMKSYMRNTKRRVEPNPPSQPEKLSENIAKCRLESGLPYIYQMDMTNRKSNQNNVGLIRSSNLCSEIVEFSSKDEYACCVLASICLPKFFDKEKEEFNFRKLVDVVRVAFRNLDKIIDINNYPVVETEVSNMRHRPIGLGCPRSK